MMEQYENGKKSISKGKSIVIIKQGNIKLYWSFMTGSLSAGPLWSFMTGSLLPFLYDRFSFQWSFMTGFLSTGPL
jgi:hypothetical protein